MDLLVVSVFFFLSPLLSLGSSDRSHNEHIYIAGLATLNKECALFVRRIGSHV